MQVVCASAWALHLTDALYAQGPHSPTFYSNGPSLVQPQGEWIVDMMTSMRANRQTKINAQLQAQEDWKKLTNELHSVSLRHKVDSWYTGECSSIPGRKRAPSKSTYCTTRREYSRKTTSGAELRRWVAAIPRDHSRESHKWIQRIRPLMMQPSFALKTWARHSWRIDVLRQ